MAETAEHGFTPEQMAWLEWRTSMLQRIDRSLDRGTIMWIIGGLAALGFALSGSANARSVRKRAWLASQRTA